MGHITALMPIHTDGRSPIIRRVLKTHFQLHRCDLRIKRFACGFSRGWQRGVNSIPGKVHRMTAHVPDLSGAEVPIHVPL